MRSWVPIDDSSDFSLQNLPYGIFSTTTRVRRPGIAIGAFVLDLLVLGQHNVFADCGIVLEDLQGESLNRYASLGRLVHRRVRETLQNVLRDDTPNPDILKDNTKLREQALVPMSSTQMHLPFTIGDYTDFYTSPYHAQRCTDIVRPGQTLHPGFFKMPLGYASRSSSVVVSGTPVKRPYGQISDDPDSGFGPCQRLDFEVEFAAFIGKGNEHGNAIDVLNAEDHIFGVVLMNDWSARDIQKNESNPLGPFNGKNFATTVSPWVVTLDALEPYRATTIPTGKLFPYLDEGNKSSSFDIPIEAQLQVDGTKYHMFECNTKNTCFSFAQMIAHHTAGGCPLRPGDLIGTGTLSGENLSELGCLLEASLGGKQKCQFLTVDASQASVSRDWLADGDTVHFSARRKCEDGPGFVGFGSCSGKVIPSI